MSFDKERNVQMTRIIVLLFSVMAAFMLVSVVCADAGVYGISGLIETPDDNVAPKDGVNLCGTFVSDFADSNASLTAFGGAWGVSNGFEIGGVEIGSDLDGVPSRFIFSGKMQISKETITKPGMAVGVVDFGQKLRDIFGVEDEASAFFVVGKNLTPAAERWSGVVSKPVRGTIGLGTGIYRGLFGGLEFSLSKGTGVKVEFLSRGIRDKSTVNAALQFSPMKSLSVEVGALGMESFYGGVRFTFQPY
jgi:hypothetical protein